MKKHSKMHTEISINILEQPLFKKYCSQFLVLFPIYLLQANFRSRLYYRVSDVLFLSPYDPHRRDNTGGVLTEAGGDVIHCHPQLLTKSDLNEENRSKALVTTTATEDRKANRI